MRQLSQAGLAAVEELSRKHGVSPDAVQSMLWSVMAGHGTMAQFQHQEFGGSGQWMLGGMIMTSDMFNNALKAKIDALCRDLSALLASQPELVRAEGSVSRSQSQSQSSNPRSFASSQQQSSTSPNSVSLFVGTPGRASGHWWGETLGQPASTGAQNDARYAWFPDQRRLAVEARGELTIYDTLDHQIGGFSQQQSQGGSMTFTSQHGLIEVDRLPVVDGNVGQPPVDGPERPVTQGTATAAPAPPAPSMGGGSGDVFVAIERLAELHEKGILTAEEFSSKKAELLGRL